MKLSQIFMQLCFIFFSKFVSPIPCSFSRTSWFLSSSRISSRCWRQSTTSVQYRSKAVVVISWYWSIPKVLSHLQKKLRYPNVHLYAPTPLCINAERSLGASNEHTQWILLRLWRMMISLQRYRDLTCVSTCAPIPWRFRGSRPTAELIGAFRKGGPHIGK